MHTFNGFDDRLTETVYRIHFAGTYNNITTNTLRLSLSLKEQVTRIVAESTPEGLGLVYAEIGLDSVNWVAIANRMVEDRLTAAVKGRLA
jgi:hypothetical protein